jgi:hypothetical protein
MTPFRLPLLACLALVACDRGPPDASAFARRLQGMVGDTYGPVTLRSVAAEGDVLVITFDGEANWRRGTPSYVMTTDFLDGFCQAKLANGYFADGRSLRVDTLEAGAAPIRGTPVTRCRDGYRSNRRP